MKTEKQIEAWLKIKITNFLPRIGKQTAYSRIGIKRLHTQLKEITDQLGSYIKERDNEK